ncbi:rho gtpase [Pelomyxa schiedti]|nr:rho gtpase [Pelomyxa schiedti]
MSDTSNSEYVEHGGVRYGVLGPEEAAACRSALALLPGLIDSMHDMNLLPPRAPPPPPTKTTLPPGGLGPSALGSSTTTTTAAVTTTTTGTSTGGRGDYGTGMDVYQPPLLAHADSGEFYLWNNGKDTLQLRRESADLASLPSDEFRACLETCFSGFNRLCRAFVAQHAGLTGLKFIGPPNCSFVRMFRSFPGAGIGDGAGEGEHVDTGLLVVGCGDRGGLEVFEGNPPQWRPVEPPRDNGRTDDKPFSWITILVGTDMKYLVPACRENDEGIKPTLHRVVPSPDSSQERKSMWFFLRADPMLLGPRCSGDLKILKELSSPQRNLGGLLQAENFPLLCLVEIFSFLPLAGIAMCARVCKSWNRATLHPSLWSRLLQQEEIMSIPGGSDPRSVYHSVIRPTPLNSAWVSFGKPRANSSLASGGTQCLKCVLVGDSGTGKTAFLGGTGTICDYISRSIVLDGWMSVNLGLWDTMGDASYDRLRPLSYPPTDVFIFFFSLTSRESFLNIKKRWLPDVTRHCPGVRFIIVGTKLDMVALVPPTEVVSFEEASALARSIGAFGYFETSSRNLHNQLGVQEALDYAIRAERGRSGGGGVLVTGVGGPDGAGAGAAGGRGAGVDSEPLFPEADVPAPRKLLRLLRLGGAFILLTVAVVYLSQVLAFGLGFVSVITGMVVGLAGGCVVLMILWCGTFKSKVLNEWFFNDARRLFHREQVYPTVVCSSGLIFLLITVPAFVFSSGWLFLKVAPFASVVLDVNTGVPLNNNYTEASVFQFYNARIGTDAISGSADSSGSYTCVAPILGRLETPETPGIEPVTFFAICDTSSNLNCNTEEARSASRCMKKWFDDDAHGGLQSGTTDSVVALSIVENNDTFAYGISENAIVVEWMDVDEEEYVRKITLIIVSTAGDILLLGLMLALYVLFHYRRKALVLMEKNIVTHSHYRHSHI